MRTTQFWMSGAVCSGWLDGRTHDGLRLRDNNGYDVPRSAGARSD
jgi:hypothetical protein